MVLIVPAGFVFGEGGEGGVVVVSVAVGHYCAVLCCLIE